MYIYIKTTAPWWPGAESHNHNQPTDEHMQQTFAYNVTFYVILTSYTLQFEFAFTIWLQDKENNYTQLYLFKGKIVDPRNTSLILARDPQTIPPAKYLCSRSCNYEVVLPFISFGCKGNQILH